MLSIFVLIDRNTVHLYSVQLYIIYDRVDLCPGFTAAIGLFDPGPLGGKEQTLMCADVNAKVRLSSSFLLLCPIRLSFLSIDSSV